MTTFDKRGDEFLEVLNQALRQGEDAVAQGPSAPERPTILIVGPPRSGTTVMTQWLSTMGFGVPTNLLARLYQAPFLGGLIQNLLTNPDFNYRDELAVSGADDFASDAGKTRGLLAPHEFFYFWRQYLPLDVARPMTPQERELADATGLAAGMARLERALDRSLAMKAIIAQYDLDLIDQVLPRAIYVHTVRDEVENVESLLRIRSTVHGSEDEWFSVRPEGSEVVEHESPVVQAAAQVAWTNDDLRSTLSQITPDRVVSVDHSRFCEAPSVVHAELADKCAALGHPLPPYAGVDSFTETHRQSSRAGEIREALNHVRAIDRSRKDL